MARASATPPVRVRGFVSTRPANAEGVSRAGCSRRTKASTTRCMRRSAIDSSAPAVKQAEQGVESVVVGGNLLVVARRVVVGGCDRDRLPRHLVGEGDLPPHQGN